MFEATPDAGIQPHAVDLDVSHTLGQAAKRLSDAGLALPADIVTLAASGNEGTKPPFGASRLREAPIRSKVQKHSSPGQNGKALPANRAIPAVATSLTQHQ